jgi:riboflavin biosynthesis pyrimidine reductase
MTNRLTLDPTTPFFTEAPPAQRPLILTTEAVDAREFEAVADVIRCGERTVDAVQAVAALRARGHARILCEGGPTLFGGLLAVDLVDELDLSTAPLLAGSRGPSIIHRPDESLPTQLTLTQLLADGDWLFARYAIARG